MTGNVIETIQLEDYTVGNYTVERLNRLTVNVTEVLKTVLLAAVILSILNMQTD